MLTRFAVICLCCIASQVYAEDLLDLYKLAKENDPALKVAAGNVQIAREGKNQTKSALLPSVDLGAGVSQNYDLSDWMSGDSAENTTGQYSLSLSYPLYRRNLGLAHKQVDSQISASEATFQSAEQDLIARLAAAYFDVLAANDNLLFAQGTKEAFKRQLDQAQQRFDVGLIAITDVQEAQAGYDLAVAEEIQAQNNLDNAYEALREITGGYHKHIATLKADNPPLLRPEPADIKKWSETALEKNPEMIAAKYNLDATRQDIDIARTGKLPTVDITASHGYQDIMRGDSGYSTSTGTSNSIGIQLAYSLYNGGQVSSNIRQAQNRYTQALDSLEQLRRTIHRQSQAAFLNVVSNISQVKALKQALKSNEVALDAVQTGFEVGSRTSVDVLNAQRELLSAQSNYARSRYDYIVNTLLLKQAAGLLTEEDVVAINAWLE